MILVLDRRKVFCFQEIVLFVITLKHINEIKYKRINFFTYLGRVGISNTQPCSEPVSVLGKEYHIPEPVPGLEKEYHTC